MARSLLSNSGMNVSLYQAAAAMNANSRWQETVVENLAASSIPGARKHQMSFSAVEAGVASGSAGVNGGRFVIPAGATSVNFQQGQLNPSNEPTDLAIEGPGFFEVQLADGGKAFTRNGEFKISAQGQLVTKQGFPVMGDSGPVQLDTNNPTPISVSASGEISQGGEVKGRLRLTDFNKPVLLSGISGGYFLADNPALETTAASSSAVRQGSLEAPNISPIAEMATLLTSMRMFEASQKVMQMQDERMGRVITELGTPA